MSNLIHCKISSNKIEEDRSTTDTSLNDNQSQLLSNASENSDYKEESSNIETDSNASGDESNNNDTLDIIVAGDVFRRVEHTWFASVKRDDGQIKAWNYHGKLSTSSVCVVSVWGYLPCCVVPVIEVLSPAEVAVYRAGAKVLWCGSSNVCQPRGV